MPGGLGGGHGPRVRREGFRQTHTYIIKMLVFQELVMFLLLTNAIRPTGEGTKTTTAAMSANAEEPS